MILPEQSIGGRRAFQPQIPTPGHPKLNPTTRVSILRHKRRLPTPARCVAALWLAAAISTAPAATNSVLNANNAGAGSLRQVITSSISGDIIIFSAGLAGQTIVLTNAELLLDKNLIINAAALSTGVRISGNHSNRVFEVAAGVVVTLRSLTIQDGYAPNGTYPANAGGGILNQGTLTLTNCTVANNQALQGFNMGGGGIENYVGTLTLHNSTIAGNASGVGGGLESYNGTFTVNQCTITGNSAASYGGGLVNYLGTVAVNQSTFTGNAANNSGGGVANYGTFNLFNSIVAGNNSGGNANLAGAYSPSGVNRTSGDPQLAPLGNYGGPTQTRPPVPGSPVIDAAAPSPFTTDQRGFPRVVGLAPDLGATEGAVVPAIVLRSPTILGNGSFQFGFAHLSGRSYTVLANSNVALPLNAWSNLGLALETPPGSGQFQFTDPQTTNSPRRFYRVRSP